MESETIDLTDPLEELLHRTGWTPEYLQERLLKFTWNNVKKAQQKKPLVDMTLNDILGNDTLSESDKESAPEIIELSDDDEREPLKKDNVAQDIQQTVTEIKVIDVSNICNEADSEEVRNEVEAIKLQVVNCDNSYGAKSDVHVFQVAQEDVIQLSSDSEEENFTPTDISDLNKKSESVNANISKSIKETSIEDLGNQTLDFSDLKEESDVNVDKSEIFSFSDETKIKASSKIVVKSSNVMQKNDDRFNTLATLEKVENVEEGNANSFYNDEKIEETMKLFEKTDTKIEANSSRSVAQKIDESDTSKVEQKIEDVRKESNKRNDFQVNETNLENITNSTTIRPKELEGIIIHETINSEINNDKKIEENVESNTKNTFCGTECEIQRNIEVNIITLTTDEKNDKNLANNEEFTTDICASNLDQQASNERQECFEESAEKQTDDREIEVRYFKTRDDQHDTDNYHMNVNSNDMVNDKALIQATEQENRASTSDTNEINHYCKSPSVNESNQEENVPSIETLDELRKNLKLQLSSLRTRKKIHLVEELKSKIVHVEYKKKPTVTENLSEESSLAIPMDCKLSVEEIVNTANEEITKKACDVEKVDDETVRNAFDEIRKIINKKKSFPSDSTTNTQNVTKFNLIINEDVKSVQSLNDCVENERETNKTESVDTSKCAQDKLSTSLNDTSSPFVSNRLDEFLTDSKLNVSYTIPKSYAEEGLSRNYAEESVIPALVTGVKEEVEKPKRDNTYKPKTLAEKRKLLERVKLKEQRQLEILKKTERTQNQSYIIYRNRKVFVKTKTEGKCIGYIESTMRKQEGQTTSKKPSLLTDLFKRNVEAVKYKAGPLSKKPHLQNNVVNWSTEIKSMPRVVLNIMPEIGKPIHQKLVHLLPKWDGEISEEQIDFALSAVVSRNDQPKIFSFKVSYENNEDQILVRKKTDSPGTISAGISAAPNACLNMEDEVKDVVQRLVDYVEIKELAPSLIKETENINLKEELNDTTVPTVDNHLYIKRKQWKRKSKVDLELLRLNCKLVNVELEDNEPERVCNKEYCSLGCVCKSLQCDAMISIHCRKFKCIFGCTCPKENEKFINMSEAIKLPAGTNVLSKDTVNRIEDQAKKNLAKIEKEFTQTVIYTSNKAIVVGCGNKARRVTKVPKKYSDFFDEEEDSAVKTKESEPKKEIEMPSCFILLDKFDCSNIIPYCLVHQLYNCHCKGHATFSTEIANKPENIKEKATAGIPVKMPKSLKTNCKKEETMEESFKTIVRKATQQQDYYTEIGGDDIQYSISGRPLRKKRKVYGSDFLSDDFGSLSSLHDKAQQAKSQAKPITTKGNVIKREGSSESKHIIKLDKIYRKRKTEDIYSGNRKIRHDKIQECFKTMEIPLDHINIKTDIKKQGGAYQANDDMFEFVFDETDSQSTPDDTPSQCSRTQGSDGKYKNGYKYFTRAALICDLVNNITADNLKFVKEKNTSENLTDCERLKIELIEDHLKAVEQKSLKNMSKKRKRKQEISVRTKVQPQTSDNLNKTVQPSSNIKKVNKPSANLNKTLPTKSSNIKRVFDGEIIIRDGEMKKSLSDGYARILPWSALIKGFISKQIGVYCVVSCPFKLILTVGIKIKGRHFKNIETHGKSVLKLPFQTKTISLTRQTENVRDIIKWLLSGTLPTKYQHSNLAFLLLEINPHYFEVRGICTQASKDQINRNEWVNSIDFQDFSDQIVEVKHRDMNNKIESLFITKAKFALRELVEDRFDDDPTDNLYMWVGLPEVFKVAKWRVVFLNNDFAYLYFKTVSYSIKYTDLIRLAQMAKEEKHTLVLKNTYIRRSSSHNQFGLYISHNYTDRIFIGPYFLNDFNEDIETLRYINKSLVSSESFNRMKGNSNYKCGHWMYERSYSHQPNYYIKDVLDLTEVNPLTPEVKEQNTVDPSSSNVISEAQETCSVSKDIVCSDPLEIFPTISLSKETFSSSSDGNSEIPLDVPPASSVCHMGNSPNECLILEVPPDMTVSQESIVSVNDTSNFVSFESDRGMSQETLNNSKDHHILFHNGFPINIKTAKPRTPSEFNRFIMTSIPRFGYLGAYQPMNSDELEISWPFERKVLQFQCVDHAKSFLQERFNQLLQPVPDTFKIEVDILTELDLTKYEPVNAKYLNGHCICGTFGIYNFRDLSDTFCKENLNVSKKDITQLFAKRAQEYIKKKIQELAEIVGLSEVDKHTYNMNNILVKAKEEIHMQEKANRDLFKVIAEEETALSKKLTKAYEMIKNMPKKYRNIESRIISDTLRIRPRKLMSNDIVEIKDDDDVEFVSVTQLDDNGESDGLFIETSVHSHSTQEKSESTSSSKNKFTHNELESESNNINLISHNIQDSIVEIQSSSVPSDIINVPIENIPIIEMAPLPIIQDVRSMSTPTYTYSRKSPISSSSNQSKPSRPIAPIKPMKLIKSTAGKFVLLNGTDLFKKKPTKGITKFTIKDNKIISPFPINPIKKT